MGARDYPKLTRRRQGAENLRDDRARTEPKPERVKYQAEGVGRALSVDLPATKQGSDHQSRVRGKHQGAVPVLNEVAGWTGLHPQVCELGSPSQPK